jgi:hypothetical protein
VERLFDLIPDMRTAEIAGAISFKPAATEDGPNFAAIPACASCHK